MTGQDLSQRMMDSQAFAAVTRAIVGFAMDDVDTGVMTQPKNTLGRKPSKSMEYQISGKLMQIEGSGRRSPTSPLGTRPTAARRTCWMSRTCGSSR